MALVSVSAYFRNDKTGGVGVTITQEAFAPGRLEPSIQELFESWSAMWDEAKENDGVDALVQDLFSQLNAIGRKPVAERTDHDLLLSLGNVYLLEREGYIRSDEFNGIQFLRLAHPGTTH